LRLVHWQWLIVTAGKRCETSRLLRRHSLETRYRECLRSISGDEKSGLIKPGADLTLQNHFGAVGEHVVVVIGPLAGGSISRGAFEKQRRQSI
jgi:hypothetical protein